MSFPTTFTSALSVETWDAHFRWRTDTELRDRTVDATWQRVASAVARAEDDPSEWERRFVDAFRIWRMLPDARLLKWAGTGPAVIPLYHPRATLNLGAFIANPRTSRASFDYQAFSATAALAVRFLDDAWLACGTGSSPPDIRVGVIGFTDALASLGYTYAGERACEFASGIARTLSDACRESSLLLAHERGASREAAGSGAGAKRGGSHPPSLRAPRHRRRTAIQTQRLIARFANLSSDALDPLHGDARDAASRWRSPPHEPTDTRQMLLQQIGLRGHMQPWIDAPIDYPLVYSGEPPGPEVVSECRRLASRLYLPEPRFRRSLPAITNARWR